MNLTSLNNVKSWVNVQPNITTSDAILNRLIASSSRFILNYLGRPDITRKTWTETQSGRNSNKIILGRWPVLNVSELVVNNQNIQPSSNPQNYGYVLEPSNGSVAGKPQFVGIAGGSRSFGGYGSNGWGTQESLPGAGLCAPMFPIGTGNIIVTYDAGYCVTGEAQNIPGISTYTLTPECPGGPWSQDDGVTYANGAALVKVSGTPAAGQYQVTQDPASGIATYTFAAADAGAGVLLNYSYVPFDLEDACVNMVGERFRYMSRIGQTSVSAAGVTTTAFSQKDLPGFIVEQLKSYRKAFPSYA